MFAAIGRFGVRRRRWVFAGALLFVLLGGVWGSGAGGILGGGAGLDNPHGESAEANALLAGTLGRHVADVVVIYESDTMTVDDPRFRQAVEQTVAKVPKADYAWLQTYWSTGSADFVSETGARPTSPCSSPARSRRSRSWSGSASGRCSTRPASPSTTAASPRSPTSSTRS